MAKNYPKGKNTQAKNNNNKPANTASVGKPNPSVTATKPSYDKTRRVVFLMNGTEAKTVQPTTWQRIAVKMNAKPSVYTIPEDYLQLVENVPNNMQSKLPTYPAGEKVVGIVLDFNFLVGHQPQEGSAELSTEAREIVNQKVNVLTNLIATIKTKFAPSLSSIVGVIHGGPPRIIRTILSEVLENHFLKNFKKIPTIYNKVYLDLLRPPGVYSTFTAAINAVNLVFCTKRGPDTEGKMPLLDH